MQNVSQFPVLKRVYPATAATAFVSQTPAAQADTVLHSLPGDRAPAVQTTGDVDPTHTLFLASVSGRLVPVLGTLLVLWSFIAWSAGWLVTAAG